MWPDGEVCVIINGLQARAASGSNTPSAPQPEKPPADPRETFVASAPPPKMAPPPAEPPPPPAEEEYKIQGPGSGGGYPPVEPSENHSYGYFLAPTPAPTTRTFTSGSLLNNQELSMSGTVFAQFEDGPGAGGGYFTTQSNDKGLLAPEPPPQQKPRITILEDDDGPGSGGGYPPVDEERSGILEDDGPGSGGGYFTTMSSLGGLLAGEEVTAAPLDLPPPPPEPEPVEEGPGSGGGYPPVEEEKKAAPVIVKAAQSSPNMFVTGFKALSNLGTTVEDLLAGDPMVKIEAEQLKINELEPMAQALKTPAEFQAKTVDFKARLAAGEDPNTVRAEAYAVAREAARRTVGMRHFDCQVQGALAMDSGRIAEMRTGEGKTITALLPLYFNALFGKGAHLVTVNDYLVSEGAAQVKPALEMLGLTVGVVHSDSTPDERKAAYAADVTYVGNDTLGFDYLRDRMATNPDHRVQREPFFALVDEVDQIFIDEARVPLIISAPGENLSDRYGKFAEVVKDLVPAEDYRVDPEHHSAYLTEVGQDVVANQLGMLAATTDEERQLGREALAAIREASAAETAVRDYEDLKPSLGQRLGHAWKSFVGDPPPLPDFDKEVLAEKQAVLEAANEKKAAALAKFPGVNLYLEENMEDVHFLQTALEAKGLFRAGKDYAVTPVAEQNVTLQTQAGPRALKVTALDAQGQPVGVVEKRVNSFGELPLEVRYGGEPSEEAITLPDSAAGFRVELPGQEPQTFQRGRELQIIDEFKGRISEGRRYSNGLHQALEAKEGLEVRSESKTVASITYPVLFRRYPRLAGMSGTAATPESKNEFRELFGLEVAVVKTNKPMIREDHDDIVFRTQEAKFEAVANHVRQLFDDGTPVLVGTRSVELNKYLSAKLWDMGVPNQALNAEDVKTNTPEENKMISNAGMSGVVTVATNMAGRGVDIKPDKINFKKLAIESARLFEAGRPAVVDVPDEKAAQRLTEWLQSPENPADRIPVVTLGPGQAATAEAGKVQIRVGGSAEDGVTALQSDDFPGKKLVVIGTERHFSRRIDNQLIGRSGRQGAPGDSYFYLSLDDELLRIYGGDQLDKMMTRLGADGLQGDARLSAFVEDCQSKVENAYYDARLNTTKFDQVQNLQRERIWEFRDKLVNARPDVDGQGEKVDLKEMALEWSTDAVMAQLKLALDGKESAKPAQMQEALNKAYEKLGFGLDLDVQKKTSLENLRPQVEAQVARLYDDLTTQLKNLSRESPLAVDVEKTLAQHQWGTMVRAVDDAWTNQLDSLEDLKSAANLQSYAGTEPIQAYQKLAFEAFEEMTNEMKSQAAGAIFAEMIRAVGQLQEMNARRPQ